MLSLALITSVSLVSFCATINTHILYFSHNFIGNAYAPPFVSVTITEFTGCTVRVEWSEPLISCGGSVSQYVLTVTPPTSDCQSSPDCSLTADGSSSVVTVPGTQITFTVSVTGNENEISVRADTCRGSLTGDISSINTGYLTGVSIMAQGINSIFLLC